VDVITGHGYAGKRGTETYLYMHVCVCSKLGFKSSKRFLESATV